MDWGKIYAGKSWEELITGAGVAAGHEVEAMRRVTVAVDRLSLVSTWLTVAIIVLMVVQIWVAVWRR